MSYEPAQHYDRITAAWTLLLGEDLHYGVFERTKEDLAPATRRLTTMMADAINFERGDAVLDVGCGTGGPACQIASDWDVRVTGITTSAVGIDLACARATAEGLVEAVSFEQRDGLDNGFPDAMFDRVWVLESSHLMRERALLIAECARVLRPRGRLALCDIILRRSMPLAEVRRLRKPLSLLRDVFGDARMEQLKEYSRMAAEASLHVGLELDLTAVTRPTFARWRENAATHAQAIDELIGESDRRKFVESLSVLERFWDDGTLGYGLIAATKR